MLTRVAYRKTSLVDFPGCVAAVLFLPGCDFRCPYCHNAALVDDSRTDAGDAAGGDGLVALGEFMAFIDRRKRLLSGVVVSGGEPLLREETPRLAAAFRERGLAVKLDTNGSFPDRLAALAGAAAGRPAVDYVALDLKTAPAAYARVAPGLPDAAERVVESLRLLRAAAAEGRLDFEIRVTCAPGVLGPAEMEAIGDLLEPADKVFLQQFRPGGCLDPAWDELAPYDAATMDDLLATVRRRAPSARIRGR